MLNVGDLLSGRFRVEQRVGQGGMAVVYRAVDVQLDRPVALKVLHDQFSADAELLERFQREARAAAGLSHPNIVDVYDVGSIDGTHYIVMGFVDGEDLATRIQRDGALTLEATLKIGEQIGDALAYAHRRGILHRDVKPHNIMLDQDGRARLTDFGIAEAFGAPAITQAGWVVGTAQYMAPERAQGEPGGPAADIYALGAVLFEMAAGRPPFAGSSAVAIALQHVQNPPPPLRTFAPNVPPAFAQVVERALAKRPSDRFSTADELAAALRQIASQAGQTTMAVPAMQVPRNTQPAPVVPEPIGGPVRGRPRSPGAGRTLAAGFLTGLLFLAVIAGLIFGGSWLLGERGAWLLNLIAPAPSAGSPSPAPAVIPSPATPAPTATQAATPTSPPPTATAMPSPTAAPTATPAPTPTPRPTTPSQVEVPNVVGLPAGQAEARLRQAQLAVVYRESNTPSKPPDTILGQTPEAGRRVEPGSVVTLTVNRAPPAQGVRVPNVEGMDEREARRTLEHAGFAVQVREVQADRGRTKGTVVNQIPDAGATVAPGSRVTVEIGT